MFAGYCSIDHSVEKMQNVSVIVECLDKVCWCASSSRNLKNSLIIDDELALAWCLKKEVMIMMIVMKEK